MKLRHQCNDAQEVRPASGDGPAADPLPRVHLLIIVPRHLRLFCGMHLSKPLLHTSTICEFPNLYSYQLIHLARVCRLVWGIVSGR